MTYITYKNIQIVVSTINLILGFLLIARKTPIILRGTPFNISRIIMGHAFIILPIVSYIYYFSDLCRCDDFYATAINLCGYYPVSALIHLSLLALIGEKIDLKSFRFRAYISTFFIYPIILFALLKIAEPKKIITITNTLLFSTIFVQFAYFYIKYREAINRTEGKYIDEIKIHIKWIKKSIYILIILAIIAFIAPNFFNYPMWLGAIYIFISLCIFIYIYDSYIRFILSYKNEVESKNIDKKGMDNMNDVIHEKKEIKWSKIIEELPDNDEIAQKKPLSPEQLQHIETQINTWIQKKGYRKSGITIITMSEEIKSNRTYLSNYINSTYNCSFKAWVTKLRIEESKKLLLNKQYYSISEIAEKAGFSSQSSFIHVFKKIEGIPPTKWKKLNSNTK